MALHQFLCGFTVVIILLSKGCQSQDCGKAPKNTGIVGGGDASPGSWPWQAELRDNVHLGRHNQSAPNNNQVSQGVAQIILHPSYNFIFNNIALLELSAPVNFTDYIRPVCLASANSTFHTGTNTWVTGWGDTKSNDILQQVNTSIVGNNQCQCYYGTTITESICAAVKPDGCLTGRGDPLVTKINDSWVQVGILFLEISCIIPNIPGIYTRVSEYEEWISNITSSNRPGFVTFTSPGVDSDLDYTCLTSPPTTTTATNTDATATTTATNADATASTTATNTGTAATTATNTDATATTTATNTDATATTTATNTDATATTIINTTSDDKDGDSVFDGGENVIHFSLPSLMLLFSLSLYWLVAFL
ncbi:chymotrypsinogen A-like protein [Lates japonicus]|uniref:Chymotrypsinogen A-like protein n=1 Tax=Lates japonicus TaxID=270547 RepID=A0AAD3NNU4_LATJO|nr:chymotrypsinogen A-like protein [Lates japonicus]